MSERADLLRRRAELHDELGRVDRALAALAEREDRCASRSGFVSQHDSPLGRRRHLAACRAGLVHRKLGRLRVVAVADLEAWMVAHDRRVDVTERDDATAAIAADEAEVERRLAQQKNTQPS